MTTKSARLGLILEDNGAKYAMPLTAITAIIAIVGFILPSGMNVALAIIGATVAILSALTWLHLQVVGLVIVTKIVADSFYYILFIHNEGNDL